MQARAGLNFYRLARQVRLTGSDWPSIYHPLARAPFDPSLGQCTRDVHPDLVLERKLQGSTSVMNRARSHAFHRMTKQCDACNLWLRVRLDLVQIQNVAFLAHAWYCR